MSSRTATFLLAVSLVLACGMDRAVAVEGLGTSGCMARPDAPVSRNGQWRYHFDPATGQKCWRLARAAFRAPARKAARGGPGRVDESRRNLPRAVANAQASLLSSSREETHGLAGAVRRKMSESAADRVRETTFVSRWTAPEIIPFVHAATLQLLESVPVLDREEESAEPQGRRLAAFDSVQMVRLLGAVLMSVGIAVGLSALIGAAVTSWLRARDRAAELRSRRDDRFFGSSPPLDSTISDIVERLSEQDALYEIDEADAWEAESARLEAEYSRRLIGYHPSQAPPRQVSRNRR